MSATKAPKSQRVVTWNVGRIYSPRGRNWLAERDLPQVVATLRELDGDVILLQELADPAQLERLTALINVELEKSERYDGVLSERCGYDRQSAALVRRALQPRFEQLELGSTGRGVVAVTFDAPSPSRDERRVAMSIHFDAFRRGIRRRQAESLAQLADARQEAVVLLGGDFNFDPQLAARLGDPLDSGTAKLLRQRYLDVGAQAGATLFKLLRLDHMLVRGVAAEALSVQVARRRLPWGDHAPLVVDLHPSAADRARGS